MNSLIDYLEYWATTQPDKLFTGFLDVHGSVTDSYTYAGFHERSRHLAEHLAQNMGLRRGDRALLVYPSGLEIIVAFFACARIGVIPVPVYPPKPGNVARGMETLSYIARDCGASVALTTCRLAQSFRLPWEQRSTSSLLDGAWQLLNLDWATTDDVRGKASPGFRNTPYPILFLQYTSGSTSNPKGVIVSHENVIHNCRATIDHSAIGVSWLPQYHDMGLIGYYLFPAITGGSTYGFSPMDFLKRPILWLQTVSRLRATHTSSPNFGFEYCLRDDKIAPDQLVDLDLSSLEVLMNAAEPVRAETYRRFLERFAPYGLRPQAHMAAYGLAENTLAATSYGRRVLAVSNHFLQVGTPHSETTDLLPTNQQHLVSCGRPLDGIQVRIVDPDSHAVVADGAIGEIWLAGKSTCQGYWNRPDLTHQTFGNTITNDPDDQNPYLRTGDIGFLDQGELFVCGRLKDLIIVRGVNYYPQDIEATVESTSPAIRHGGVAAFGHAEEDALVLVVEVRSPREIPDPAAITRAIRLHHAIVPHTIVFVPARSIVKTTSGKHARSRTRQRWLNGELSVIATHSNIKDTGLTVTPSAGIRERFRQIIEPGGLTGNEDSTLSAIGIDSLTLVALLVDIERFLEEHGAADMVKEIDARFIQRLTVAQLYSLVEQFEQDEQAATTSARLAIRQLKQEHDDRERECMRLDTTLPSIRCADRRGRAEPLSNILLTGATGFFGPFLLGSLLLETPYTYYALVRAPDQASGTARIRESMRQARVLTPALNEALERRVHVLCGDVAKQNLGLGAERWESLTTEIQAVIHNAALVNYVLSYSALRMPNVYGTRELLRFSCMGSPKEFHHISSTIIFGWTAMGELLESERNEAMQNLDFGYAQSKWVAEQLVIAAESNGLRARIYRPSFISASSLGAGSKDDVVIRLLAFMINHGIAVNARNQISFLPADIAASNIASIIKQRHTTGRTFHVTVDTYYSIIDVTRTITQEYGYPFVYYDIPDFVAEIRRRCGMEDPLYPLLDFIEHSHVKIGAMQHKRYSNRQYREALHVSGNWRADPSLKETVSYLMAYMVQEGIIRVVPG